MEENELYEAFGVEPVQSESASDGQQQEQSDGQENASNQAAEVSGQADGGGQDGQSGQPEQSEQSSASETGDQSGQSEEPEKREQSEEERRENAARRRREEQQAAVNAAVAEERKKNQQDWSDFFQGAKLKNTITGEPINSREDYQKWKTAFDAAKLQRDLQAGKLSAEQLNDAIAQNPTIRAAEERARQEQAAAERARQEEAKKRIDADIAEIGKYDPSIRSVGDLVKSQNAQKIVELVRRGNTFLEAYRLANFDSIVQKRQEQSAAAAKQQAMSNARSKEHLQSSAAGSRGKGAASVPPDEMRLFREMMPEATEADIQAYYNSYHKGV